MTDRESIDMTEYKTCSRCKQILPLSNFNKKSSAKSGYASACKICTNNARKEMSPAQRERKNAQNRKYRANNPEVVAQTNRIQYLNHREQRIELANAWIKANPEKHALYRAKSKRTRHVQIAADSRRRRARLKANGVFLITKKEIDKLLASKCFYCGSNERITIDHVIAIARGGTDGIGNLVPACKSCNSRKRELTIMEWRMKGENPRCSPTHEQQGLSGL